jgi:protein-S-isoprenylcysteine O-methyltransferase Ste14
MKLLTDWGFSREGWRRGQKGEYWVVAQGVLLVGFALLPIYRPAGVDQLLPLWLYLDWGIAAVLAIVAIAFLLKGVIDLGASLTPLPYPKEDGQLVQSGVYGVVRHPLYSGLILAALGWSLYSFSLVHLIATIVLFVFFNAKAMREEAWLAEKYPDYSGYQQRVKRLIPWIY